MTTQRNFMGGILGFAVSATEADWERLYADELPRVYNFFRYRVDDDSMAEDLTSTTFEKAWRGRARYRRDLAAFSTWLFSIARHVAIDYYRQRRVEITLDEVQQHADELTPDRAVEQRDEVAQLGRLIKKLPDRERDLLALKYGAGLSNREIARITSLSESNIGTILYRVVRGLRSEWQE